MAGLIYDLIKAVEQELSAYGRLLVTMRNKNKAIVNNDLAALNASVKDEQTVVIGLQRLERTRQSIIKDIAYVLNADESTLTITELAQSLENQPEEKQALESAGRELRSLLREVKAQNDQNSLLIQQSLEIIDYTFNAIQSSFSSQPASYTKYGNMQDNRSFFDTKR